MGSDSIVNGSAPAFSKDFGKKKRTNRLAKLKQCKLDARREQWLSQAKNKGCKEESNGGGGSPPSLPSMNEQNGSLENLETRSRGEENEGSSIHDSDLESLVNGSTGSDSRKDRPGSSCGSSISSSSSGCCSGNFSEEEDDGCLDDWEAIADALNADDKQKQPNLKPSTEQETHVEPDTRSVKPNKACGVGVSKTECKNMIPKAEPNSRAWKSDDAFRPQSLPNLSKQYSLTTNACLGRESDTWARYSSIFQPSSCPICYEDLDITDSSFLPCLCGFRLCLFCHKRILEEDGRCPGCRKQYGPIDGHAVVNGGAQPLRLACSCSMSPRSTIGKESR